jgi:hypothetical protein
MNCFYLKQENNKKKTWIICIEHCQEYCQKQKELEAQLLQPSCPIAPPIVNNETLKVKKTSVSTTKARKKVPLSVTLPLPSTTDKKKTLSFTHKSDKKKVIDLDRHCAVRLENGELCSRSLKCKIHPISLKRQVPGRSQNYDLLFNDYTRHKSSKEDPVLESLTPEEEVQAILKSLSQHQPQPLATYTSPSLYKWNQLKAKFMFAESMKTNNKGTAPVFPIDASTPPITKIVIPLTNMTTA